METTNSEIFKYLLEIGCCRGCALRYVGVKDPSAYTKINEFVEQNYAQAINENAKKQKPNPCTVCVGLLQDFTIDSFLDKISVHPDIKDYDSETFTCSVSMPASIFLREHSVKVDLEKRFSHYTVATALNKTWKWAVKDRISDIIHKEFETSETCPFSIHATMLYASDESELSILQKMLPEMFSARQSHKRKYNGEIYSRKCVTTLLTEVRTGLFTEHFKVPPDIPEHSAKCDKIDVFHNSIYLAGRYCKYSRNLSQTPWIVDSVKTMETSVQEIICGPVQTIFNFPEENIKFASSGREDVDVRCVGAGRPFYLEIVNPKRTRFDFQELRDVENEINKSEDLKIKDLQIVDSSQLNNVKLGEEDKTKDYTALCVTNEPFDSAVIEKINAYGPVELSQKTPVRVLHRRPLADRKRTVYEMNAKLIPGYDKMFKLHVTTQAGTYVKEFVHGDLGRTKPSLGDIVGMDVDIIALDVTAVHLDWPKPVNYA